VANKFRNVQVVPQPRFTASHSSSFMQGNDIRNCEMNYSDGVGTMDTYISTNFHNLLVVRQFFYASGSPCSRRRCRLSMPGVTKGLKQIALHSLPIFPLLSYCSDMLLAPGHIHLSKVDGRFDLTTPARTTCHSEPSTFEFV